MTDINEVRARLERLADDAEHYGMRVLARPEHVRALLDDHARLQAEAARQKSAVQAIDLEQLRVLAQGAMDTLTQNKTFPADVAAAVGHMRRLLALIDRERPARQKAVELLLAQGYRWHNGEWIAPAPAIDLDLVREAVEVAIAHAGPNDGALAGWQHLLALIDGQVGDNSVRVDRGALQMALNVLRRAGKCEVADALAGGVTEQPTKGEGE